MWKVFFLTHRTRHMSINRNRFEPHAPKCHSSVQIFSGCTCSCFLWLFTCSDIMTSPLMLQKSNLWLGDVVLHCNLSSSDHSSLWHFRWKCHNETNSSPLKICKLSTYFSSNLLKTIFSCFSITWSAYFKQQSKMMKWNKSFHVWY